MLLCTLRHGLAGRAEAVNQDELFERPDFCPIPPSKGTAAWAALVDLLERGCLATPDWIETDRGWRLAATIKELGYLGWEPKSVRVKHSFRRNKIAEYSLHERARKAAESFLKGGQPCA